MRRNPVCERGNDEGKHRKAALWMGMEPRLPLQDHMTVCSAPDTVPFNPYVNTHLQPASHCCFCSKLIYWHRFKHSLSKLAPVSLFKQHLLPHQLHLTKSHPVFKTHFKHYLSEDLPERAFLPHFHIPTTTITHVALTVSQLSPFVRSAASLGDPQRQHLMSLHISCGSCRQQAFNICRITHIAAILSLLPLLQEKDRQPSPMPGTITILRKPHFAFFFFFFWPGHTALEILVP